MERQAENILKVVDAKRLSQDGLSKALAGNIEDSSVFIADKHPSYKAFEKTNQEITNKTVRAWENVNKKDGITGFRVEKYSFVKSFRKEINIVPLITKTSV